MTGIRYYKERGKTLVLKVDYDKYIVSAINSWYVSSQACWPLRSNSLLHPSKLYKSLRSYGYKDVTYCYKLTQELLCE